MSDIQWVYGVKPEDMTIEWRNRIRELFFSETNENYKDSSLLSLKIPEWDGNLMLIDREVYPKASSLKGIFWSKPFMEDSTRIVAFVIDKELQSRGHGGRAWSFMQKRMKEMGVRFVQLEVKCSNIKAQEFYRARGMKIISRIDMYYKNEHGYMMRGKI